MAIRDAAVHRFKEGDLVTVNSLGILHKFCIIGFKKNDDGQPIAVLKALFNQTFIIEKPITELTNFLLKGKL